MPYSNIQMLPSIQRNGTQLHTWGSTDTEYHSTLEKAISWNAYEKEGLGINHEQWLKEKEASRKAE